MDILSKSVYICCSYSQSDNKWNFIEPMSTILLLGALLFKPMTKWPKETGDFLQIEVFT